MSSSRPVRGIGKEHVPPLKRPRQEGGTSN